MCLWVYVKILTFKIYFTNFLVMYPQRNITVDEAYGLLKKYRVSERRIRHSEEVAKLARKYAKRINEKSGFNIDLNFVYIGALLHDIGRGYVIHVQKDEKKYFMDNQILLRIYNEPDMHMFIGGKILRNEDLEEFAKIAERHGLAKEAAITYDKPGEFEPEKKIEKIITIADMKLVELEEKSVDERIECLRRVFTKNDLFVKLKHLEDAIPRIKGYEMELMGWGAFEE